jgi:hypothetical protein
LYGVARDQDGFGRIFGLSADGSDYRVIKQFDPATDMTSSPFGLIQASDGRLYGITGTGAPNSAIYGINNDGSGFEVLHRFGATSTDGRFPRGLLLEGPEGNLFGVTASDRTAFLGTVYRLGRDGSGYEIIHRFVDGQGTGPDNGLILATDGFLYGQATGGGASNIGGVFKLRTDGSDYQFIQGRTGGAQWYRGVTESGDGYVYGANPGGGSQLGGTILRVRRDGTGYETLHEFSAGADPTEGVRPKQLLHASDGYLYCITYQQSATPITGVTAYTPYLLRFGPVPLPSTQPPALMIVARFVQTGQNSEFKLSFTGEPGREYDIQATDVLPPTWQSAQKITADSQGNVEFTDDTLKMRTARFLRVVAECLIVTPGLTIKDRLRVLQPNDPDSYYSTRDLIPSDLVEDIRKARIVITNYHALKRRERLELSAGGRALLEGATGPELQTLETEGQMLQRVMPELMGMKHVMALNDEAHHCYREKPPDPDEEKLKGDERKEAEKNNEAARHWISGLETVNRTLGLARVFDLSATPFSSTARATWRARSSPGR